MEEYLYIYFINFSFWLFIEEAFLAAVLPRRKHFLIRLLLSLAVYFCAGSVGCLFVRYLPAVLSICWYLFLFLGSLAVIGICMQAGKKEILFVGTAAYAVQHITYAIVDIVRTAGSHLLGIAVSGTWFDRIVLKVLIYIGTGYLAYKTLSRSYRDKGKLKEADPRMIMISFAVLLSSVVLSEAIANWSEAELLTARIICRLYAILSCLMGLIMQFEISFRNKSEEEQKLMEQMLQFEKQHHQMSQDTMDMINRKCHDIKYQLAAFEKMEDEKERAETIEELKNSVLVYDGIVHTGNDTLDLVLAEKCLVCQKHHIQFSCMADGKQIEFMKVSDIYSLFGNAMDNAIEAELNEEEDKRIITLQILKVQQMIQVHLDNYCKAPVTFEENLPVTTKSDKSIHGFGTRSIRYIAEKYNGTVRMSWENGIYSLDILF